MVTSSLNCGLQIADCRIENSEYYPLQTLSFFPGPKRTEAIDPLLKGNKKSHKDFSTSVE